MAGNIDKTLFAYYCTLLIADRNRQVYWTFKEGTSDVPHYWYREFDLNLGPALGNIQFGESVWTREFQNATLVVNPGQQAGSYSWDPSLPYYDVTGQPVVSPLVLGARSAMLLVKTPRITTG